MLRDKGDYCVVLNTRSYLDTLQQEDSNKRVKWV